MATLRQWFNGYDFDWDSGKIIYQETRNGPPGWGSPKGAKFITYEDSILDMEFSSGYGGPMAPRIIAEDNKAIYFISQYDGATEMVRVWKDIKKYLDYKENPTPYPGG